MVQERKPKPVEKLASALQECLSEAAELGANKALKNIEPCLDRQDETLRMVWKQCGGSPNARLPIDDNGRKK